MIPETDDKPRTERRVRFVGGVCDGVVLVAETPLDLDELRRVWRERRAAWDALR